MLRSLLLASLVFLLNLGAFGPALGQDAPPTTVVYLVRHAERADDHPTDPTLTPEGRARAELLANMLGDSVTYVYATTYRRTRLTAAPLAARTGVSVQDYDPDEQSALADRIRQAPGRHLVVGHSNTLRALVGFLGGEPGEPIADDEYDRLYVLTIEADGAVRSALRRYGPSRALTRP